MNNKDLSFIFKWFLLYVASSYLSLSLSLSLTLPILFPPLKLLTVGRHYFSSMKINIHGAIWEWLTLSHGTQLVNNFLWQFLLFFAGDQGDRCDCHVCRGRKTLNNDVTSASLLTDFIFLSGIINTLGHAASKLALQAKGCHSPDNYFWKRSPNYKWLTNATKQRLPPALVEKRNEK